MAGLQPAFYINNLLEIQESLKKAETQADTPEGAVGGTPASAPSRKHCFQHPEEELKFYCQTCGELVCLDCVIKGGKHHNHEYGKIHESFSKYKEEMTSSLEPMEKQVETIRHTLWRDSRPASSY